MNHDYILRDVSFVNNVTITSSDEQMTKIKVVDLDELYNFVVDDFFIRNYLVAQNTLRLSRLMWFKYISASSWSQTFS